MVRLQYIDKIYNILLQIQTKTQGIPTQKMQQNQNSQLSIIKSGQCNNPEPQQNNLLENTSQPITHSNMMDDEDNSENMLISKSIEKGRLSRFAFEKFKNMDHCLLLFCIMNVFLSVLYYDSDFANKTNIANWCLTLGDIISIIQIIVTIIRYYVLVQLQKCQKLLTKQQTIHTSGKTIHLILQIMVLLIQPYSFLDGIKISTSNVYDNFTFEYKINYVLVVLGFGKIFIAVRVILLSKLYMSPRSSRLCRMYGCQSDYIYAIKCLFKDTPLSLIGIVFVTSILIFAICLRIAQRNLVYEYPKHFQGQQYPADIQKFENALWLTIITMTTVGYGDFFPRTVFGRVINVVLVVWGTFVVSLMVVVLTNTLKMDQSEKRALIVLNRLQTKKSLKQAAAFVITHSCRKYLINKRISKRLRPALTEDQRIKLESSFYKYLSNFQKIHRIIRSMYQIDDVYEQMTRQFQFINDQVSVLLSSQQQTITNIYSYINQQKTKRNDLSKSTSSLKNKLPQNKECKIKDKQSSQQN